MPVKRHDNNNQEEVAALVHKAATLLKQGLPDEAWVIARQVLEKSPCNVGANLLLGIIAGGREEYDLAVRYLTDAITHGPGQPMCHFNLGLALHGVGQRDKALAAFEQAIRLEPNLLEAHHRRAIILIDLGRLDEALAACDKALLIAPDLAGAHNSRGVILNKLGRPEEAIDSFSRALDCRPDYAEACCNRGDVLRELGFPDKAEKSFRRALELKPDYVEAHCNLILLLASTTQLTPGGMLEEQRHWDEVHGKNGRLHRFSHDGAEQDDQRRLRIGYVSPDFYMHSVSYFFEPLLGAHNRDRYEIFCYAAMEETSSDAVTARLRGISEHWRFVSNKSDRELAELIQKNRIDILVDLAGHTRGNRLGAFTYRPAPVQATYIGFFAATGLEAMDYWITDEVLHPRDTVEETVEQIVRLPRCWVCYKPPDEAPAVAPCPNQDGPVVFGSFSNISKLTPDVIETWSRILAARPESRLLLMDKSLPGPKTRERLLGAFRQYGIPAGRLLVQKAAGFREYLGMYNKVDIVLDPFPRTGGTTTAEALWMGVPVVTLAGERYVERISASKLHAVGLGDLVCRTREDYIDRAIALADDPGRRAGLRSGLRDSMAGSPLCDAAGLASALESAYEEMWGRYLEK